MFTFTDSVVLNDAIGFTAIHSDDGEYREGDIVKFNEIVTNIGNHFNPLNYIFTCPIKGMYMFSVSVLSEYNNKGSRIALMRDGAGLVDVYLSQDASPTDVMYNSASAVIVVECDIDQRVYVEATQTSYIDWSRHASHFSGALIQRL